MTPAPTPDTQRIVVDDVSKTFNIRHTHSLKEWIVAKIKGRREATVDRFRALDHVSFQVRRRGRRPAGAQRLGQVDAAQADLGRDEP